MTLHVVRQGETAWSFAKEQLAQKQEKVTNTDIANELKRLAKEYDCSSVDDFAKKYFIAGKSFEVKTNEKKEVQQKNITNKDSLIFETAKNDAISSDTIKKYADSLAIDSTEKNKTILMDSINFRVSPKEAWEDIKKKQDRINNLPSDKERVIAYNKEFSNSKENYIIVDKKACKATIYAYDGTVIKEYEIGVAKEKSDRLLRRSKKHPENNIASTSAGIYTANYKATGRDAYARLYNDKVLTLSNDGLRDKGVGNGETGVALHQIPNGNKYRRELIDREGISDKNNRFSSGCVNFRPEDFDDMMANIKGVGTKVYILPEDKNNYMSVKNGKLHFSQKTYTNDVATTTTKKDPIKLIRINCKNSNMRQEGIDMATALADNKPNLAKELGLDNDTYNELALIALGIAGQETKWGDPLAGTSDGTPYYVKEKYPDLVVKAKKLKAWWKGEDKISYNSRGMTQMKVDSYVDPTVKELLKKHKITDENLQDPEKSAIATMIVLACIYKNELPSLKEDMAKCNLSKTDALLYCFNGRKSKIKNGTAAPSYQYIHNVQKYGQNFAIEQIV